jgi:gamma-glutamyltranspeptidase
LGHDTVNSRSAGITQAIIFDPQKKVFMGVHDPRTQGAAKGQ